MTSKQINFIKSAVQYASDKGNIDLEKVDKYQLQDMADACGMKFPHFITRVSDYRVARGFFRIPVELMTDAPVKPAKKAAAPKKTAPVVNTPSPVVDNKVELKRGTEGENKVPSVSSTYIPFGNFKDVNSVVKSGQFFPTFITGLSGNGKTEMVEQVCAKTKREMFRVNITVETDEDDLIGGFRLIDGETVWFDGPVIEAMRRGAILLLDEIDLASNKIMCLQPVMEGKGIYIKKINEYVEPAEGFNVMATANTKGKGDESGMFMFTGILNEAFLERFPITLEQDYPSEPIEKKILSKVAESLGIIDDNMQDFISHLVQWGAVIRKTFADGAIDEIITTRRLVHIVKSFAIFGNREKSIDMCINRFDEETKNSFMEVYSKIDATIEQDENEAEGIKDGYIQMDDEDLSAPF